MLKSKTTVTMAMGKTKLNRTIAREILIFFSGLLLTGFVWGFLALRNSYYDHKISSCSKNVTLLKIQLDSLPQDYIREFYDKTSKYFVVYYKIGKDFYTIPKEQEKDFLTDEFGIQKKVAPMFITPKGYSYVNKDSAFVFDYVILDKFRNFIASEDYQEKLFYVFSNNPNQDKWVNVTIDKSKPAFDPLKPYNGIFDLGTLSEFKAQIRGSLNYNQSVIELKNKIEAKLRNEQDLISSAKNSILTSNEMHRLLINSLIIIGLLLFPIRLSILLIFWAFKVIKQKQ